MPPKESGFFEASFARTRSLIRTRSIQRAIINRQNLQALGRNSSESAPRPGRRSSRSSGAASASALPITASKSFKRRKQSKSIKCNRNSTAVQRAASTTAASATAPISPHSKLELDMATLPNDEILSSIGRPSPTSNTQASLRSNLRSDSTRIRPQKSTTAVLSPIPAGTEMTFHDPKASAVTHKHSRTAWGSKSGSSSRTESRSSGSTKSRRPRIEVVVPQHQLDRPLPTSPFFAQTNNCSHTASAATDFATIDGVSPPSASHRPLARDLVVSPLSAHRQRPSDQFHASINSQIIKPGPAIIENSPPIGAHSSSDDSHEEDDSSVCSKSSSLTSAGESPPLRAKPMEPQPSALTGVVHGQAHANPKSEDTADETGARVAPQTSVRPRRYAHHPPIEHDVEFKPSCVLPTSRAPSDTMLITVQRRPTAIHRVPSRGKRTRTLLLSPTIGVGDLDYFQHGSKEHAPGTSSPTLSEAENELEHLISLSDDSSYEWDDVVSLQDPVQEEVSSAPPAVPRRSSKRLDPGHSSLRMSRVPSNHIASQVKRNRSRGRAKGLRISIPRKSRRVPDELVSSPIPIPPKSVRRIITADVAENIICNVLQQLDNSGDLWAAAQVNKGFYEVFKRNKLDLVRSTLRKMSPPAWEFREICYPGHDQSDPDPEKPRAEYTAETYTQYLTRDRYIIAGIKSLIRDKCESFLRPEMAIALASNDPPEAGRVDDALWRIWTFCKIFGSGRGREEDIVAQMDWLRGGVLVHQKTCTYSILSTDAIDMSDTLASAPECFAKGNNDDGLTAEQLFDMMELWNCLGVLLQGFEGRTVEAREHGVYDNTDIRGGDIDGEEEMLDEWYYYLLTLGLSTILDLAGPCRELNDPWVFVLASSNGLMNWKAPVFGGTRRNFLKEAASRVYEDKIANIYAESSTKEVQRHLSKQRIQRHITELHQRKHGGERMPEIRMSQERPISEWEGVIHNLTRPRPPPLPSSNLVTHIPSLRSAAPASALAQLSNSIEERPTSQMANVPARPRSPPSRIVAEPLLPTPPPSTVPSVADRASIAPSMPSIEEHPAFRKNSDPIPEMPRLDHPAFIEYLQALNAGHEAARSSASTDLPSFDDHPAYQQHPMQKNLYQNDPESSADRAIFRIVEMGFTAEQARSALRRTDSGGRLRVDRAVELLLREVFA